jgi:hypothetical protein
VTSAGDAAKGIYAAWRLLHGERGAVAWFDASITGFWRSFAAAIVAAPAFAALVALSTLDQTEVNWPAVTLVQAVAYVMDWFAFPLAALYVCDVLGKGDRYLRLIVALNWARVIESALILPGAVVAGLAPQGVLGFVPIAIFLAVMAYHWFVIRVALDGGPRETLVIFLLNLGVGIATSLWARSILT